VIRLNQTAYLEPYFNMAILASQENIHVTATFPMKQYLLLTLHAKDVHCAQDKTYEWELMMQE
jgi:hypothetical protein